MIRFQQVHFSYPGTDFGLHIDDLGVAPGETLAVIGSSGSGKTSLLRLIAGLVQPQNGAIHVAGQALHRLGESGRRHLRAAHIGFVFQELELLDYLDVFDNIVHAYRLTGVLRLDRAVRERAKALADELGIGHRLRHRPPELSGGERQRVAICRALLTQPQLILADEATGHLDPTTRRRALDVLLGAAERQGATVIAVTHDHEQLVRFDRVLDCSDFRI